MSPSASFKGAKVGSFSDRDRAISEQKLYSVSMHAPPHGHRAISHSQWAWQLDVWIDIWSARPKLVCLGALLVQMGYGEILWSVWWKMGMHGVITAIESIQLGSKVSCGVGALLPGVPLSCAVVFRGGVGCSWGFEGSGIGFLCYSDVYSCFEIMLHPRSKLT